MAFAEKLLAEGQLASSKSTIYTVPSNTKAYVKYFRCFNTGSSNETIIWYVKRGTSRKQGQALLAGSETCIVLEPGETLILEAGDLIEAQTTTATTVDYVLSGIEKT